MPETIHMRIKRQKDRDSRPYWEEFKVPYQPNMNVISVLMEIQKNPVNVQGETVEPVVWDSDCLEEVCGACTVVINGMVRQACSALVDKLEQPIVVEPMATFPTVRDLMVDRTVMFDHLKQVRAWIDIDGTHSLGPGPRYSPRIQEIMYDLSRCMTCGACLEACPNVNDKSLFIGPAALSQVRRFNLHPSGQMHKEDRLETIMGPGGLPDCGNAQNCVEVCPKEIPLTTSIAELGRSTTFYSLKRFFGADS